MKILLINPPFLSSSEIISKQYPLNLAYLGTYLEEKGFSVKVIDLNIANINGHQFKELLLSINPQVVGITVMTATFDTACKIVNVVKNFLPGVKIIAGGSHVSALPEAALEICRDIDCIVVGEGEETFSEICMRLENNQPLDGIKGTVHRSDGKIKYEIPRELIENLDCLPFPRRDYIGIEKYRKSHVSRGLSRKYLNIAEMILSRGCSGSCIFCATNIIWRNKIRFRSVRNILAEIEYCREKLNAQHFSFEDDSFTANRNLIESLCAELKRIRVTWNCNLRVDMVTRDLLRLMSESGCIKVQFGIESGSERILGLIKKDIVLEQISKAVEWANLAKIRFIEGAFILGVHPEESQEDVSLTLQLTRQLKINLLMLSLACPFPGTELYEIFRMDFPHDKIKWEDCVFLKNRTTFHTKYISSKKLIELQRRGYIDFYFRPKLLWRIWKHSGSVSEKVYWFTSGMHFLKNILPFAVSTQNKDGNF